MRARNIKPSFFKNDILGAMPPMTRLLFAGIWCMADREGRLEDRPGIIRVEIFPFDAISVADVDAMLNELVKGEFIFRYEREGKKCISISNFLRHQFPHHRERESLIPAPGKPRANPRQAHLNHESPILNPLSPILNPESHRNDSPGHTPARGTWLTPFFEIWKTAYGGTMESGPAAKFLAPLVKEHGPEKVQEHFRRYCAETTGRYVSIPRFASTFGDWDGKQKAKGGAGDVNRNDPGFNGRVRRMGEEYWNEVGKRKEAEHLRAIEIDRAKRAGGDGTSKQDAVERAGARDEGDHAQTA